MQTQVTESNSTNCENANRTKEELRNETVTKHLLSFYGGAPGRSIALSLCEEILAFSHAFGSLAVRRVAL